MKKRLLYLLSFLLLGCITTRAQEPGEVREYINTYKGLAIAEMQRTGVPAAIKLAQGIHETGAGTSKLVLKSNNHFGIKCKSNWTGESVRHDDDARGECFRKYPSAVDSYRDHSDFLKNSPRYASLFSLDPEDYQGWANGLKNAGYATNPNYPQVLIKLIEDYNLEDYTLIALGKLQPGDEGLAKLPAGNTNKEPVGIKSTDDGNTVTANEEVTANKVNYPEGEFKINDTKVIYVKKGTPFLSIAQRYDVPLSKLFEFNEIDPAEDAGKDQLIYLQRKRKTGNDEFHVVQPGETLHDIAQLQAIRLESLLELNWLKEDDRPAAGEQLNLRKKSGAMPKRALKENYSLLPGNKSKPANR
jgi:LysM repeat protein